MSELGLLTRSEEDFLAQLDNELPEELVDDIESQEITLWDQSLAARRDAIVSIYGLEAEATASQLEADQLEVITHQLADYYVQDVHTRAVVFRDGSRKSVARAEINAALWRQHLTGATDEAIAFGAGLSTSATRTRLNSVVSGLRGQAPALRKIVEAAGGEYVSGDLRDPMAYTEVDGGRWKADAICAQTDPEAYFPESHAHLKASWVICQSVCEVREQCLAEAKLNNIEHGIWGGMTPEEREADEDNPVLTEGEA